MKSQKISFTNRNGQQLAARLEEPVAGPTRAYALFAHCFTCSKDLIAVKHISRALTHHNIGVFRFDFTGLGESEGDFADTNFSSDVSDLSDAAEFLQDQYGEGPKILIGHSLGGAAVLLAAQYIESAESIVTIGAPAEPKHVIQNFQAQLDDINEKGATQVTLAGRSFTIKKQFIDNLEATNMQQAIHQLKKPLLLFHSPQDNIVGIDNAEKIYKNALHPKSFISLDGASHLLTNKEDSYYVGQVIAAWAQRYVSLKEEDNIDTEQQVVTRIGTDHYPTEVKARQHHLMSDEPKKVGGSDTGPSPYELLNAGLGSCTAITLRMYADRKEWPLEEVRVHLSHQKQHAEDCEDCEKQEGKIDLIERNIEVKGNLTEQQRQRLLEIANKCPVHKTLHNEIKVRSRLLGS